MSQVLGLDVSADRIAWAFTDGQHCETDIVRRGDLSFDLFVTAACAEISPRWADERWNEALVCFEINLHPKLNWKSLPSANMVRSYMRSMWVVGSLIDRLCHEEPQEIKKLPGGYHVIPGGQVFALQASGGKGAKEKRRYRMETLYTLKNGEASQDEVDALALANECHVALKTGMRANQ